MIRSNGKSVTVLVSSAGRRVELMQCFRADAAEMGIALRVLAADANPSWSAACHAADAAFKVPRCTSEEFIPAMLEVCKQEEVDLIIPTIDPELDRLAETRDQFHSIGTAVAISSPEVVRLARNKLETARVLAGQGLATPKTAFVLDMLADPGQWSWPLLLKPVQGSSSVGLFKVDSPGQARELLKGDLEYVAQELVKGREYTVNMFFGEDGRCRSVVPHWRCEVRNGEVSKGMTERHPALMMSGEKLGEVLVGARGALCFQAIVDSKEQPIIFEINARFGGGYPIAHRAGARFSQWLLEETVGLPFSGHNRWVEGLTMLRYDAAYFFEKGARL